MTAVNTKAHFQQLFDLSLNMQVTDRMGVKLTLDDGVNEATRMIISAGKLSRKVMLIGNGGSAAIASHAQNDLCKAVGIRATTFYEQPLLTAYANDMDFTSAFEQPVRLWANNGDILLAISSSGRSKNILRAVLTAGDLGCQIITLSGFDPDNPLRQAGHINFYVSSHIYGQVEVVHAALVHCLTDFAASHDVKKFNWNVAI